jgi:extradiol dioxygenase family protein
MTLRPFHLALPVKDLISTREFYGGILGLNEGRSAERWIDWDFFGHQISTHISDNYIASLATNLVDGHAIPVQHYGLVMAWQQWHDFRENMLSKNIRFLVKPYIRFKGEVGEQATMFFSDYSGNALEFKSFKNEKKLFQKTIG